MRRANNNIPGGAKAIGDVLWPSALVCGQAASLMVEMQGTSWQWVRGRVVRQNSPHTRLRL